MSQTITLSSALIFCAWGEKGAAASGPGGEVELSLCLIILLCVVQIYHADAFAPGPIIDTLGAGDTFNAGVIYSLTRGKPLKEAIKFACRLAGTKCCSSGYDTVITLANS